MRLDEAQPDDLVAEQLAGARHDSVQHVLQRSPVDDRALDLRQALEQRLALAQGNQQPRVLRCLPLALLTRFALVFQPLQHAHPERHDPGHSAQEMHLVRREAALEAGQYQTALRVVLERHRHGLGVQARPLEHVPLAAGDRHEVRFGDVALREAE